MNQQYPQLDQKTIETLKAARDQVVRADKGGSAVKGHNKFAPLEADRPKAAVAVPSAGRSLTGFAEEFVQKLTSIGKETAEVDEEIAKAEKLWVSLTEKKKQLEARRNELTKVKDKLKELDKEMSEVLKSQ